MARKAGDDCKFRQRDVQAAIKAAHNAGLESFRIEIDKRGTISVVPLAAAETEPRQQETSSEWDKDL
jgi:hypothetical protein